MRLTGLPILALAGMVAGCVMEEGPRPAPPQADRPAACTFEYAPVCGERRGRRETYGNACMARAEGAQIVHGGECRSEGAGPLPPSGPTQACTREYQPVCAVKRGEERQSFPNACVAEAERARIIHEGECRGAGLPRPPQPPPTQACTREYSPVCAIGRGERRTFGNACEAEVAWYRIIHEGEC
ncbi:Kazal-type serine protease inhibitor domain-containing protein [Chelativorans alearense]|uniref:Kazal-type serine protease inhibitor domain-containing protein n=1 Tax=Chelativorans alearense TaxID=2681495 RepID=UPI0031B61072